MTLTLTPTERRIGQRLHRYRDDPCGFITKILSVPDRYFWAKMRAVAESVRDHQFTAVPAGHSVSKTFGAGRIVVWFKACFQPSTVITTAPSDNQVRNQLWREIHGAYSASAVPLGGKVTTLMWDARPADDVLESLPPTERQWWDKNFAIGFSTSPDYSAAANTVTKMQGWHNRWVLIVIDEACGIHPQIWDTIMRGLVTNKRVKVLAIGNPTDPEGKFAGACRLRGKLKHLEESSAPYTSDTGWHVVPISVLDTPNYQQGREVIPGLAGRDYEQQILREHRVGSNEWLVRVRGAFPTHKHGAYYGDLLDLLDTRSQIGAVPHHPGYKVHTAWDLGYTTAVWFWQQRGPSSHVIRYYEAQGLGMDAWGALLDRFAEEHGYRYGRHFAPFDATTQNGVRVIVGTSIIQAAREAGIHFTVLPLERRVVQEGIPRTREILPLCHFDKEACKRGLWCLRTYHEALNASLSTEDNPVFTGRPAEGPELHGADAFRYLSMALRRLPNAENAAETCSRNRALDAKYARPE